MSETVCIEPTKGRWAIIYPDGRVEIFDSLMIEYAFVWRGMDELASGSLPPDS